MDPQMRVWSRAEDGSPILREFSDNELTLATKDIAHLYHELALEGGLMVCFDWPSCFPRPYWEYITLVAEDDRCDLGRV